MKNRGVVAGAGLVGAVLIGGVAQTYAWRWDIEWLSDVSNSQFLWVLWSFLVAWAWSRGRVVQGAAAGAATGLALIVSYYLVQWVSDGRHSATSQFADARGAAWTLAAVGGGAAVGILGGLAAAPAATAAGRKAFGLVAMGLVVGAGPSTWLAARGGSFQDGGLSTAATLFAIVGLVLLVAAARTCGAAALLRSGALAAVTGATALAVLFALEHTVLYLTF